MAATKYSITPTDYLSVINQIENALNAKGLITATLYKASGFLIFTTPLLNKVIKISINSGMDDLLVYYGDAWTSGSTITNQIRFGAHIVSSQYVPTMIDVIADSNFFTISWQTSYSEYISFIYVGGLSNGDDLVFAMTRVNDSSNGSGICLAVNLTTGESLYPIGLSGQGFKDSSGNIYTMPLMWANSANVLQLNNGNPADTIGIKVSSSMNNTVVTGGSGYILLPSSMYYAYMLSFRASLLIEYTP